MAFLRCNGKFHSIIFIVWLLSLLYAMIGWLLKIFTYFRPAKGQNDDAVENQIIGLLS